MPSGEWASPSLTCRDPETCDFNELPNIQGSKNDFNNYFAINASVTYYCDHNKDVQRSVKCKKDDNDIPQWTKDSDWSNTFCQDEICQTPNIGVYYEELASQNYDKMEGAFAKVICKHDRRQTRVLVCSANGQWVAQDSSKTCPVSPLECLKENPMMPFATPISSSDNAELNYQGKRTVNTTITYKCDYTPEGEEAQLIKVTCQGGSTWFHHHDWCTHEHHETCDDRPHFDNAHTDDFVFGKNQAGQVLNYKCDHKNVEFTLTVSSNGV